MTITLITGLPRSGTNLVCACLNTLPDCVALTEPMRVPWHGDADRAVAEIVEFAVKTRAGILADGVAPSRTVNGVIADNFFAETRDEHGVRHSLHNGEVNQVTLNKPLTPDFRLFIKHPAIFTVLAPQLAERMPLYAIVRHPLAVLGSWQTVDIAARQGRWPVVETYAPDLRARLDAMSETLDRQIELLRWHFQVYRGLPRENVVTYESVVLDPSAALRPLSGSSATLTHPVRIIDPRTRYASVDLPSIARRLISIESDVAPFYPDFADSLRSYIAEG